MAKVNFKNLLVDKGEKYALIAAGALMLLFAILGVLELSASPDTDKFIKDVSATTNSVTSTINGPSDPKYVAQLPDKVVHPPKIGPVSSNWVYNLFFDPIAPPDKRRINPVVLPIAEMQADFMWAKMLANDVREGPDGPIIGVVPAKGKDKLGDNAATLVKEQEARQKGAQTYSPRPGLPQAPKGGPNGAAMPAPIETGPRDKVEYLPLDPEKLKDKRLAWTIYPRRMVVVQASFPFKAQIEEIQRALRLENPIDVFDVYKPEETPLFKGVLVQRQVLLPDGTVETPWTDLDVVSNYMRSIYPRKYGDKPDDPSTQYVLLHKGHRLVMPLPMLMGGKYPEIRMETIKETIKKQIALNKPPEVKKDPSQLLGQGDPFESVRPSTAGGAGQPNSDPLVGKIQAKEVEGKEPATAETKFAELPEFVLIRFIDDDITPGRLFQYRMKVLMQNPNWWGPMEKKGQHTAQFKRELVSRPSDAEIMLLGADGSNEAAIKDRFGLDGDDLRRNLAGRTDWKELEAKLSVPREEYLFAADPVEKDPNKPTSPSKPGQGWLQIQRWLPIASIDKYKEPVADWVVADVLAIRGTYLGGRQLVNLPLWSSEVNKYVLRSAEPEKGKTTPRRGVFMDPTRPGPQYAVVDVEGGCVDSKPLTRNTFIKEFTAAEILLLDENGALQVRSSYADRPDVGRASREKAWKDWIDKTERDPDSLPGDPNDPNKKKSNFD